MRISGTPQNKHSGKWLMLLALMVVIGLAAVGLYVLREKLRSPVKPIKTEADIAPLASAYKGPELEIDLKQAAYERLETKREAALKQGLLYSSKDDFVPATIRIEGESYDCKLRLKGDLMDHLQGQRWSFRIVLDGKKEWRGMNTFNIHNSKSRAHTAEWLMHKLFDEEGIVCPQYDFVEVKLNGQDLGAYAYEHHFENQLLEQNNRELGPILKHSDDAYWENVQTKLNPFPWIAASDIVLFNKTNYSNSAFRQAYEQARAALNDFLNDRKTVAEVFDVELMAKYYALLDLTHAWHAQAFTNIRFYANPMTGKLEPIAYDCFGDELNKVTPDWEALGQGMNSRSSKEAAYDRSNVYRWLLFQDEGFFKLYMQYLNKYTQPGKLQQIIAKYGKDRDARVAFIKTDLVYKDFNPNWDVLFKKSTYTYKKIQPRPHMSLKAKRVNDSKQEIDLQSFHYFPLELIGFGTENLMTDTLTQPLVLEAYNNKVPVKTYRYRHSKEVDYLYFKTLGLSQVHKTKLQKEGLPMQNVPTVKTTAANLAKLPFVTATGKDMIIAAGTHTIERPIVIPADKRLVIAAGAQLFFKGQGKLLCYGQLIANGSAQQPIVFSGDNTSGTGVMVSSAESQSTFEYCRFLGLNNFKHAGVITEAGVTLYRTAAKFKKCSFQNTKAKFALLASYAQLEMTDCKFTNCQGTALESSYSAVKLTEVDLSTIGKNGFDFTSGSLNALNIKMDAVLNHAMHFTNGTNAYVYTAYVTNSYQSLFANKHAKVKVINYHNTKVERGIEVRTPAVPKTSVELEKFHATEVRDVFLIKSGLSIMVDGKEQRG